MKKSEILVELPKFYTETQSEQMLLKKWHQQQTCSTKGCHKSSICKKTKIIYKVQSSEQQ